MIKKIVKEEWGLTKKLHAQIFNIIPFTHKCLAPILFPASITGWWARVWEAKFNFSFCKTLDLHYLHKNENKNQGKYGEIWPYILKYGEIWSYILKYGEIWSYILKYGIFWNTAVVIAKSRTVKDFRLSVIHSFFYKNNFIRTPALYLTKSSEQAKNNPNLTFSKN